MKTILAIMAFTVVAKIGIGVRLYIIGGDC